MVLDSELLTSTCDCLWLLCWSTCDAFLALFSRYYVYLFSLPCSDLGLRLKWCLFDFNRQCKPTHQYMALKMPMINNDQHDVVFAKTVRFCLLGKKSGSNMGRGDDASVLIISNALKRKFLSPGGLKSRHTGVGAAWRFEKSWHFCWFPSCVGSEWIPRGFRKFTTYPGFGSLICISALGSKSHRSIDVDNTPFYTYTFGINIPGNSPGYILVTVCF